MFLAHSVSIWNPTENFSKEYCQENVLKVKFSILAT